MTKEEFDNLELPRTTEDVIAILMKMRYATDFRCMFRLSLDRTTGLYSVRFCFATKPVIANMIQVGKDPEKVLWGLYNKLTDLYNGIIR